MIIMEIIIIGLVEIRSFYDEDGLKHKDGDEPAIKHSNGTKKWFIHGKSHRENDPAVELSNGDKFWCENNLPHRLDGPAIRLIRKNVENKDVIESTYVIKIDLIETNIEFTKEEFNNWNSRIYKLYSKI